MTTLTIEQKDAWAKSLVEGLGFLQVEWATTERPEFEVTLTSINDMEGISFRLGYDIQYAEVSVMINVENDCRVAAWECIGKLTSDLNTRKNLVTDVIAQVTDKNYVVELQVPQRDVRDTLSSLLTNYYSQFQD